MKRTNAKRNTTRRKNMLSAINAQMKFDLLKLAIESGFAKEAETLTRSWMKYLDEKTIAEEMDIAPRKITAKDIKTVGSGQPLTKRGKATVSGNQAIMKLVAANTVKRKPGRPAKNTVSSASQRA